MRRISELNSCPEGPDLPEVKYPLKNRVSKKLKLHVELHKNSSPNKDDGNVKKILFRDMVIDSTKVNNTVELEKGSIARI